ncbi:MAG: HEAT repeat domain-containing protein [Armatimonadota bacterium]
MSQWIARILFGAVVAFIIGSAIWNNIVTNRLIEEATGRDLEKQKRALTLLSEREDFFDLIQSRRPPRRLRVALGAESLNNAVGVKVALAMLRDPEPRVRDRFLQVLLKIGGENLDALAEGLKNPDANVKNGTVKVMVQLGIRCLPVALKAFENADARSAAAEVLVQFGSVSVPGLLDILNRATDEGLKLDAITALGRIGDRRATDALLPYLNLPTEKRRIVLVALGSIADPRTESILIEALRSPSEDPDARAQVALGLGQIGTPSAIRALTDALGDLDSQVADAAAQGLQKAGGRALDALAQALSDSRVSVRLRAVTALSGISEARSVELLRRALSDPDARVQRAAADALGVVGRPEAVPALIDALRAADGGVAMSAVRSLSRIGKPALPALLDALRRFSQLDSPELPTAAYFAALALSQIPEAEPALLRAAQEPATRRYALIALKARRTHAAKPLFEQALNAPDHALRQLAHEALMQLSP